MYLQSTSYSRLLGKIEVVLILDYDQTTRVINTATTSSETSETSILPTSVKSDLSLLVLSSFTTRRQLTK